MHRGERCTFHLASHSSPAMTKEHVQWWAAYRAVLFFSGTLTFPLVSIFWLYFHFTFQLSPGTNFFFFQFMTIVKLRIEVLFFFFSFSTFCKKWVKMKNVGISKFLIFNLSNGISGICHGTDKFPLMLSDIPAPVRGVTPSRGWHSRVNSKPHLHNSTTQGGSVSEHVFILTHSSLVIFPSKDSWTRSFQIWFNRTKYLDFFF